MLRRGQEDPSRSIGVSSRWPFLLLLAATVTVAIGCGKKGPPLPPLVRVPAAPADLVAERRGDEVGVRFVIPAANADGTRPANIERVDVYGFTGSTSIPDDQLIRLGSRIASVEVKAPSDPDRTIDADEPASDLEPLTGPGLDQGTVARVEEHLARPLASSAPAEAERTMNGLPLLGPPAGVRTRIYAGVPIDTRGRPGPMSNRAVVPLVPAPPAPSAVSVAYDETGLTVTWTPAASAKAAPAPSSDAVLPATPLAVIQPTMAYHVYEVGSSSGAAGNQEAPPATETRLTSEPSADVRFVDKRIEWGATRCYTVRTVEIVDGLTVESVAAPSACMELVDRFAPASPSGLTAVPSDGAISLIWDPSNEADLGGYLVLRGAAADALAPLTPAPIKETTFKDTVPSGQRFVYAVQAVDTAGNVSEPSATVDEAAR